MNYYFKFQEVGVVGYVCLGVESSLSPRCFELGEKHDYR
jgi:hypothetical protein